MRKIISVLSLFASVAAFGNTTRRVPVIEDTLGTQGAAISGATFGIESSLSRAWIEVRVQEENSSDDTGPSIQTIRSRVEGLSYDSANAQIVFAGEGSAPVVCAHVVTKKFLWHRYEKQIPTGLCQISAQVAKKRVDNGFELVTREVLTVELIVQSAN